MNKHPFIIPPIFTLNDISHVLTSAPYEELELLCLSLLLNSTFVSATFNCICQLTGEVGEKRNGLYVYTITYLQQSPYIWSTDVEPGRSALVIKMPRASSGR